MCFVIVPFGISGQKKSPAGYRRASIASECLWGWSAVSAIPARLFTVERAVTEIVSDPGGYLAATVAVLHLGVVALLWWTPFAALGFALTYTEAVPRTGTTE